MRVLRIALALVVGMGALTIGWSLVNSGQLPDPLTNIGSIVRSVGHSIGDTFRPER